MKITCVSIPLSSYSLMSIVPWGVSSSCKVSEQFIGYCAHKLSVWMMVLFPEEIICWDYVFSWNFSNQNNDLKLLASLMLVFNVAVISLKSRDMLH